MRAFGRKRARQLWERQLAWFRLRYTDAAKAQRAICLLSRPDVLGRVGLYYLCENGIAKLFIGVTATQTAVVTRLAYDFGLLLTRDDPVLPVVQRLVAVEQLPWQPPSFTAQIVAGQAFLTDAGSKGMWLPKASATTQMTWRLPLRPPFGMSAQACWEMWQGSGKGAHELSIHDAGAEIYFGKRGNSADLEISADNAVTDWPLGYTLDGKPLYATGNVNLYGRGDAIRDWLTVQLTQMLTTNPAQVVVIDGVGDLVPQLKRKAVLAPLFGEQIRYVNIDGGTQQSGFNPLAALPNESTDATVQRWRAWFAAMNVHPSSLMLLDDAASAGVTDLLSLDRWLKGQEKRGAVAAVASLRMIIQRMSSPRVIRAWLEWPTNLYDTLSKGALLFGCRSAEPKGDVSHWSRQQLLHAIFLAARAQPDSRIILHGFPWKLLKRTTVEPHQKLLIANGPQRKESVVLLTENHEQGIHTVAQRFIPNDLKLQENLALLQRGECVALANMRAIFADWSSQSATRSDTQGKPK